MYFAGWLASFAFFLSGSAAYPAEQQPLLAEAIDEKPLVSNKGLHGRFLHITGTGAF